VISINVSIVFSLANNYTLSICAADVLSPCHLEAGKELIEIGTNVQNPAAPAMDGDRVDVKTKSAICCEPVVHVRITVGNIGFQAQDYRVLFAGNTVSIFDQSR